MVFLAVVSNVKSWTIKKAECRRTDAFEVSCWRRLLRVPWTVRRSNQSIVKEINLEYSLKGLVLKLQSFGHRMWKWSESEVALPCLTLWDPVDCSLPGSSIHGIFQARILEWDAISFSRRSSRPRDQTQVSCMVDKRSTIWATREVFTWCEELTYWKRPWCWEQLKTEEEGSRVWDC